MARKTAEELEVIKKKYGVDTLWSWSKYNLYKTDRYEWFLKYVLHKNGDKPNSIYTYSGGLCHDIIEKYYSGEIKQEEMLGLYEDGLFEMEMADYKYDRSDSAKNEQIGNKYEGCVKHFFKHHVKPDYPMVLESFQTILVDEDIVFQGYIDNVSVCHVGKNALREGFVITDYKTSTIYKGEKLDKESGQLYLYAEAIRQKTKMPLDRIKIQYLFLKYVTVDCLQANGKWKTRHIERNAIGENLSSSVLMWLKKEGYTDKMDDYIQEMVLSNAIDNLPDKVKEKFVT